MDYGGISKNTYIDIFYFFYIKSIRFHGSQYPRAKGGLGTVVSRRTDGSFIFDLLALSIESGEAI